MNAGKKLKKSLKKKKKVKMIAKVLPSELEEEVKGASDSGGTGIRLRWGGRRSWGAMAFAASCLGFGAAGCWGDAEAYGVPRRTAVGSPREPRAAGQGVKGKVWEIAAAAVVSVPAAAGNSVSLRRFCSVPSISTVSSLEYPCCLSPKRDFQVAGSPGLPTASLPPPLWISPSHKALPVFL